MTAGVGCRFTVHFSTLFSTTSFRDPLPQTKLPDSNEQVSSLRLVRPAFTQ